MQNITVIGTIIKMSHHNCSAYLPVRMSCAVVIGLKAMLQTKVLATGATGHWNKLHRKHMLYIALCIRCTSKDSRVHSTIYGGRTTNGMSTAYNLWRFSKLVHLTKSLVTHSCMPHKGSCFWFYRLLNTARKSNFYFGRGMRACT